MKTKLKSTNRLAAAATDERCTHERLSVGPIADVQRCRQCGVVSLHMGAITVRLDAAGVESLCTTLGEALAAMHTSPRSLLSTTMTSGLA